jgi:DHA1 family inner membrane transport protein
MSSQSRRPLEVSLALGVFSIAVSEFASMSVLPNFTSSFGVSVPDGGRAISAYALGVVVGAPLLAMIGAVLPRRQFLVAMIGLFALGNVASALAPTFESFVVMRFICGLPHGAYFGVACLFAAELVSLGERGRATARIMFGFTVGTIIGVPLVSVLSRSVDWRWAFALAGSFAAATAFAVWFIAPRTERQEGADWRRELGALKSRQVWLTLGIGAIGQGGMFCIFTYLASALDAAHATSLVLPAALMAFGIGMAIGVMSIGWFADRYGTMKSIFVCLSWAVCSTSVYALMVGNVSGMIFAVALVGAGGGLAAAVQTRLMDVAGESQVMAAALNHAAFNVANAIGPLAGGAALRAGFGWSATGWVGACLAATAAARHAGSSSRRPCC